MPQDLSGKTILVTGASKGIGATIARAVSEGGAHLVAHYGSDRAGIEATVAGLPADRVHTIAADLGTTSEVDRLWKDAIAWRGRIDVLVNNAAVMRIGGGIEDSEEAWDRVWDEALRVNVLAPARLMRHAVRHYLEAGGGVIVTLSSWAAQRAPGNPALLAYATSKAAVLATTKTIARHYGKKNILAYMIAPGVVRTQLSVDAANAVGGEAVVSAGLAMGEWIPPEEIGALVAFLATGKVRHLSGATLDINGASYIR